MRMTAPATKSATRPPKATGPLGSARLQRRFVGQNQSAVREHNRCAVLRALLNRGPTSRSQLTRLTGLQPTTVSSLVSELLEQQIILEVGSTAPAGLGRPTIDLDFAPGGVYAIGVNIGVEWIAVGLVSARGQVHAVAEAPRPAELNPAETLSRVIDAVRGLLAQAKAPLERIVGIGVGMPGLVDPRDGRAVDVVDIGWHDVPILPPFRSAFELPVIVANNVQAMALAESWFGAGRESDNLALLFVGSIVGAGLVIDGRLLRGASFGAGQIGHSRISQQTQERCACGHVNCLETLVSEQALLRDAARAGLSLRPPRAMAHSPVPAMVDALIAAGQAGDSAAEGVLARAGEHLGSAAAHLINVFNPTQIVLAGRLARAGELILGPMRQTAADMALPSLVQTTRFVPSALGVNGRIVGPASLALVDCFYTSDHALYV